MLKKLIAVLSCASLVPALWATPPVLGSVDAANGATLSGVLTSPGTTVFDGDVVATSPSGRIALNLLGGSYAAVPASSEARVLKRGQSLAVELERGAVVLSVVPGSAVEGVAGDVSFRPSGPGPSTGLVKLAGSGRVVFYADKGGWVAAFGHDGRNVVLAEGQKLEALMAPNQTGEASEAPGGKNRKKRKAAFLLLFGGVSAGLGIGISQIFPGSLVCVVDPPGTLVPEGCSVASPVVP